MKRLAVELTEARQAYQEVRAQGGDAVQAQGCGRWRVCQEECEAVRVQGGVGSNGIPATASSLLGLTLSRVFAVDTGRAAGPSHTGEVTGSKGTDARVDSRESSAPLINISAGSRVHH